MRAVDKIDRIYDFNVGQGGPIMRDKLWFFGSARAWSVNAPIADTFYVPQGDAGRLPGGTVAASRGSTISRSRARCSA